MWTRVSSKITYNTLLNSFVDRDHSLVLIMEGKKLSLQVDKMEEKSVEMDCEGEKEKKKRGKTFIQMIIVINSLRFTSELNHKRVKSEELV